MKNITVDLGTPRAPKARWTRPPIIMGARGRTARDQPSGTPHDAGRDMEKVARGSSRCSSASDRRRQHRAA